MRYKIEVRIVYDVDYEPMHDTPAKPTKQFFNRVLEDMPGSLMSNWGWADAGRPRVVNITKARPKKKV